MIENGKMITSLERNPSNSSSIFLLGFEFWKYNCWIACFYYMLHACKIKKKKIEKSIAVSLMTCLNLKFLGKTISLKNMFIDWIVNNIRFERNLTCVLRI